MFLFYSPMTSVALTKSKILNYKTNQYVDTSLSRFYMKHHFLTFGESHHITVWICSIV